VISLERMPERHTTRAHLEEVVVLKAVDGTPLSLHDFAVRGIIVPPVRGDPGSPMTRSVATWR
jgi:hypothetical protein